MVTRSQARLTAEKLAEMKDAAGFAGAFLIDGKVAGGRRAHQTNRFRRHPRATRASRARRFLSRRCRPRDRRRSGAHRQPGDARRSGEISTPGLPSRSASRSQAGTLYNTPPPTQGLASLIILALFDRLRVAGRESFEHIHGLVEATKRAFRVRDRVITDPDKIKADSIAILSPAFLDAEAQKIDRKKGRALAGALRRRRYDLDGCGGRERPRRLLHPVALLGVRLRLRAARDRHR